VSFHWKKIHKVVSLTVLQERLEAANRDAFENDVHEYMFYDDDTPPPTPDYLWRRVENIYKIARACNDRKKDENAWSKVLEKIVSTALKLSNTRKLELNSVQTQNIEPGYLASTGSNTVKKADFVLAFTDQANDIKAAYRAFTSRHGHKSFSPMTHAYTFELAFACAFELKEPNGGHSEAETHRTVSEEASRTIFFGVSCPQCRSGVVRF
jgi:hypothetical protein